MEPTYSSIDQQASVRTLMLLGFSPTLALPDAIVLGRKNKAQTIDVARVTADGLVDNKPLDTYLDELRN